MEGDAHAGPWHRQVSLLAAEDTEEMRRTLPDLKPGGFAENLLLSGVDLSALGLGSRLRLGGETDLTVTQLGKACHRRCAIYYQAGDCIMPRLGLFARVLRGGTVVTGDTAEVLWVVPRKKLQAVILTIGEADVLLGRGAVAEKRLASACVRIGDDPRRSPPNR
jgi:MOSC domain-containing protein YiiM